MLPLHKLKHTDKLRPHQSFIQVKNGFVYKLKNAEALIKAPASEVFGDAVTAEDELYFDQTLWGTAKFDKAIKFSREDNLFTAHSVKGIIGQIKAYDKAEFEDKHGRMPDLDAVMPAAEKPRVAVEHIGFNTKLLAELCEAMGQVPYSYRLTFYGPSSAILVQSNKSNAVGVIMPTLVEFDNEKENDDWTK